jgi:hypothetical protein
MLRVLLAAAFPAGMSGYCWWQIMMQVAAFWLQVV